MFEFPVRVYYEDTDAGGVVYHAKYLNFMERARTEWLRAGGFEQDELRDRDGVIFAVNDLSIRYRRPARFNDALRVTARVDEARGARLRLSQQVIRQNDNEVLADAEVQVVCLDAERFRPVAVPSHILEKLLHAD
jgi:acyl-CoA thioester hydrolase